MSLLRDIALRREMCVDLSGREGIFRILRFLVGILGIFPNRHLS